MKLTITNDQGEVLYGPETMLTDDRDLATLAKLHTRGKNVDGELADVAEEMADVILGELRACVKRIQKGEKP